MGKTKKVTLEEAKEQFEELLEELLNELPEWESVEFRLEKSPSGQLNLSSQSIDLQRKTSSKKRIFGQLSGQFKMPTDEEWATMDREIEKDFEQSEVFPK